MTGHIYPICCPEEGSIEDYLFVINQRFSKNYESALKSVLHLGNIFFGRNVRMKKFFCMFSAVLMSFVTAVSAYAGIYVNSERIDVDYVIENSRTLIPVRGVFEKLGYDVDYNAANKTAVLKGDNIITITAGQTEIECNGRWIECQVPQKIIDGRFYVPLRTVVELIEGYNVEWEASSKNIYIKSYSEESDSSEQLSEEDISKYSDNQSAEEKLSSNEEELSNDGRESLEKQVFELINQERAKNGLSELQWSDELADVAREHSQDMAYNNYFNHTDLNGGKPSDRIKAAGITYMACAENIAAGSSTAEAVVQQWMNSEGHRANILNPNLNKLGVGLCVEASSQYVYYWTQCFTD